MALKFADTAKPMGLFPVAEAVDIELIKKDDTKKSLQAMYDDGELGGGKGLPLPEQADMIIKSYENEDGDLDWKQAEISEYTNLDTGADLNTLVKYGTYRITTKRVDRIDNVPVQTAGMLEVRVTGSIIYQTYRTIDNDAYIRSSEDVGTSWTNWEKYLTDADGGGGALVFTKAEWEALDPKPAAGTQVIISDDTSGGSSEGGTGISIDILWNNGQPAAAFNAQTITIPGLRNYKLLLFETRYHTTLGLLETKIIVNKLYSTCINTNFYGGNKRDIEIKSDSIVFGNGCFYPNYATGTFSEDNNFCYPVKIYGIK